MLGRKWRYTGLQQNENGSKQHAANRLSIGLFKTEGPYCDFSLRVRVKLCWPVDTVCDLTYSSCPCRSKLRSSPVDLCGISSVIRRGPGAPVKIDRTGEQQSNYPTEPTCARKRLEHSMSVASSWCHEENQHGNKKTRTHLYRLRHLDAISKVCQLRKNLVECAGHRLTWCQNLEVSWGLQNGHFNPFHHILPVAW